MRALEQHAALPEEARELAVDDRGADLRLDVVADDRQSGLLEAGAPVLLARDEDRHAVDVGHAGGERLLDVPLRGLLGAHREVAHEHVGLGLLEDPDDVGGRPVGLGDDLAEVLAEAVVGHAAVHLDARVRHLGEVDRVVLAADDRLRQVLADLVGIDVEGGHEVDVADVVAAEVDVHQPGHEVVVRSVAVVLDALHERGGAVADAHDGDADAPVLGPAVAVASVRGHACSLESCSRSAS